MNSIENSVGYEYRLVKRGEGGSRNVPGNRSPWVEESAEKG